VIINFIGVSIVALLALVGLTTIISFVRHYRRAIQEMKYARIRIEWESSCVTYKVLPYTSDKTLSMVLGLVSTATMREETSTEVGEGKLGVQRPSAKRLVQDRVKAVTVVHKNWPRPTATDAGEA
jgi:hypothetical protein